MRQVLSTEAGVRQTYTDGQVWRYVLHRWVRCSPPVFYLPLRGLPLFGFGLRHSVSFPKGQEVRGRNWNSWDFRTGSWNWWRIVPAVRYDPVWENCCCSSCRVVRFRDCRPARSFWKRLRFCSFACQGWPLHARPDSVLVVLAFS